MFLTVPVFSQSPIEINAIEVQPKINGLLVRLSLSAPITPDHLAGWQAENQWFYITLFQCQSDSAALMSSFQPYAELDRLEVLNSKESTQLAFRLHTTLEAFEFQFNDPGKVDIALRFPRAEILAALESEAITPEDAVSSAVNTKRKSESPFYLRIRSAAYLVGVSLTVSGILANDNQSRPGWELPTGISILGLTYVYDHFIRSRVRHE
ncbi:MAG: DUF2089 domain-containing protein [FCB group bacterium]|nr:DUF2089 domain-containing protein [FCB group bacterium]